MRSRWWMALIVAWSVALGGGAAASAQSSAPPAMTGGTGQKISLDLKGVDILDVLKLLSQKSGLNFVAGRNVSGRVTIFVNSVDVWDAFELIIGANDLAYERRGDIVTVMMARDYELIYGEKFQERKQSYIHMLKYAKVVQVATVLNQLKSSVGRVVADEATNTVILSDVPTRLEEMKELVKQLDRPTEARVYKLNYTEADKLKEKVQEVLSPVGTFSFDARSNTVVISDLKEVLAKTDRIIHAFDVPDGQVLIEAKIVNVILTDDKSLGIDWQRLFSGIDVNTRTNLLTRGDVIGGDILAGASAGTAIQMVAGRSAGKILLEALNKIGKTETLSNPRLMVSNNQEAKILVGTKEAFITSTTTVPATGSTVTAPEVKTEDVGTKLYVTPNIKRDGYVQMKIRPEVSSVARTVTSVANTVVPIIQTTEAETNVLVKSGVTLIIGGLIDTKDVQTDNRVPWLADLPVVGPAFRGQATTKKKSELVVFLTPQIIMPNGSPFVFPDAAEGKAQSAEGAEPVVILQDPVPPAYRHAVRQRLQAHLISQFQAASLQTGSVVYSFVLSHDGQLIGAPEVTSPQGDSFIRAAQNALAQAQPFPPFPEGSDATEVRFRMAVDYSP
ncbi:MAG: energy transducer TonB [Candidatus Omnitrophica bacterium]|nr:energy transducer TonB [Candidatus Omnitrophota bacterium]